MAVQNKLWYPVHLFKHWLSDYTTPIKKQDRDEIVRALKILPPLVLKLKIGMGLYNSAIDDFTRAIELDPNDAKAYNNRGIAYRYLGEYQQAIDDSTKAIELDSNDAEA